MDRLEKILTAQLELQRLHGTDPTTMIAERRVDWFRQMVLAATDELHEALNEVGWKEWASSRHVNQDAAFGELRDALQFLINLLFLTYQVSPAKMADLLTDAMMSKLAVNARRQRDGYDGVSTKCPACRRALEDVVLTEIRTNDGFLEQVLCVCNEPLDLELAKPFLD